MPRGAISWRRPPTISQARWKSRMCFEVEWPGRRRRQFYGKRKLGNGYLKKNMMFDEIAKYSNALFYIIIY